MVNIFSFIEPVAVTYGQDEPDGTSNFGTLSYNPSTNPEDFNFLN